MIVRKGLGALHIARAYGDRYITRCGHEYADDEVAVWRSKRLVSIIWAEWPRKCSKCRAGIL